MITLYTQEYKTLIDQAWVSHLPLEVGEESMSLKLHELKAKWTDILEDYQEAVSTRENRCSVGNGQ